MCGRPLILSRTSNNEAMCLILPRTSNNEAMWPPFSFCSRQGLGMRTVVPHGSI